MRLTYLNHPAGSVSTHIKIRLLSKEACFTAHFN